MLTGRLRRTGVLGRAGWSFADQALSSLSNAALSVLMAKATGVQGYGAFAVAFTVYVFLLGVSRGLANLPYLMRFAGADPATARSEARAGTGLGLTFGVLCAVLVTPVALAVGGTAGAAVAAMTVLLPVLIVQDVWRSIFIGQQRPRAAAANGALWAVVQFSSLGVAIAAGVREPVPLIVIWALTGWVAAGVAVLQGSALPSPVGGAGFARRNADISRYLVAEWLTLLGASQLALLLVGVLGSAADIGSIRAAQTLLGPLMMVAVGALSFLVPELSRRPGSSARSMRLVASATSAGLTVLTLVWGLGLLALPEWFGRAVLGEVWPGAREALLAMTLWMVGAAVATGPLAVIRACGQARASFTVNVLVGSLLLTCTPIGFLVGGVAGAAAGLAVANLAPVPLFWLQMQAVLRRRRAGTAVTS